MNNVLSLSPHRMSPHRVRFSVRVRVFTANIAMSLSIGTRSGKGLRFFPVLNGITKKFRTNSGKRRADVFRSPCGPIPKKGERTCSSVVIPGHLFPPPVFVRFSPRFCFVMADKVRRIKNVADNVLYPSMLPEFFVGCFFLEFFKVTFFDTSRLLIYGREAAKG